MPTKQTDADKLAEAESMVRDGLEQAKAARLPSAQAAVDVLGGTEAQALLTIMRAAIEANIDDIARPLGQPGNEGTKQLLQRVVTSLEGGLINAQQRLSSLQPTPEPVAEPIA